MIKSFIGAASLEGKKGYAVKSSGTTRTVAIADANADCIGIIYNENDTAGEMVGIALPGEVVKVSLGGSVSFGNLLKADANGELVAAGGTGDDNVIARALEDGTADGGLIDAVVVYAIK